MRKAFLIGFGMLVSLHASGFFETDSTGTRKTRLKPTTDFDQRFSFIKGNSVNIWGYRGGLLINDKYKLGIGGYFLTHRYDGNRVDHSGNPIHRLEDHLWFGTVYYEPFLIRRETWEMSIVTEAGYGRSTLEVFDEASGENVRTSKRGFIPVGAGLSASYKVPPLFGIRPLRWFGLNGLVGYRKTIFRNTPRTDYDGFFWSIGTAIFLDRIVDDVKYWRAKKRQPQENGSF